MSRIFPIIIKEFIHISRDFRTLIVVIVLPVVMLFLYGFAINMEIQNINMLVLDHSNSPESSSLIRKFSGSDFYTVLPFDGTEAEIETIFANREADMALILAGDFAAEHARSPETTVQILIDASDPNAAQAIRNYTNTVIQFYNMAHGAKPSFEITPTVWYNPSLKSAYFFVPGLAALILIMISALLTSVAIVREKETGTMEQILVSPVRPVEIIIGKVVPYIILAFLDLIIILNIAYFVFDVPFVGSLGLLIFCSLLFIFTSLSLGLFISTKARAQQVAMMMALVATLLPTVMLSGFMFPLSSLPAPLRVLSHLVPARYYLVIIRGIMLKGNHFLQLLPQVLALAGMAIVLMVVSARKFKTNLEG